VADLGARQDLSGSADGVRRVGSVGECEPSPCFCRCVLTTRPFLTYSTCCRGCVTRYLLDATPSRNGFLFCSNQEISIIGLFLNHMAQHFWYEMQQSSEKIEFIINGKFNLVLDAQTLLTFCSYMVIVSLKLKGHSYKFFLCFCRVLY
jgi:hypothetical protein